MSVIVRFEDQRRQMCLAFGCVDGTEPDVDAVCAVMESIRVRCSRRNYVLERRRARVCRIVP